MFIPDTVAIDDARIANAIAVADLHDSGRAREALAVAREMKGLDAEQVAALLTIEDPELLAELFATARELKENIYGRRLVVFAPLYVSNLCGNDCAYCSFRASNHEIKRRALSMDELRRETEILVEQGHKRVLLVAGEAYPREGFDYILRAIDTIYECKVGAGEIRRINVNVAPLSVDEFRALGERRIGTYQIFQETYHRPTYAKVHLRGRKTDYDWRITAMDRAFTAGIDDVGIGVLFGLADWRYEILAMLQHIRHLEYFHGVGPHTISVPRLEPAAGAELASRPPHPVDDATFCKIVAILRLAVPYTGIIMSTRETARIRRETFALGVSQISAGSRTNPGGYAEGEDEEDCAAQFSLGDHRPLDEVIRDVAELGYVPSFCTGCYRLGRTGADFMDLAKPGEIRYHCDPNALCTFTEYLLDYSSAGTRGVGESCIASVLAGMEALPRSRALEMVARVRDGKRDIFC